MKRVKIIIPQQKRYILSLLWDKFPNWSCDMLHDDRPIVFTAMLQEGVDYASDLAWLKRIGLAYFDEKMERETLITAFFKEMIVEGMAVTNVSFPEDNGGMQGYFRVLVALHNAVVMTLQLPDGWEPPTIYEPEVWNSPETV